MRERIVMRMKPCSSAAFARDKAAPTATCAHETLVVCWGRSISYKGMMISEQPISLDAALDRYEAVYLPSRNLAPLTRRGYLIDIKDLVKFLEMGGVDSPADVGLSDLEHYL